MFDPRDVIEATPPLPHVTTALDTLRADVRAVLSDVDHRTLTERLEARARLKVFAGLDVQS